MIRPNLEAQLEAKKEVLNEVKSNIANTRATITALEDRLTHWNSVYADLTFEIEDLEEQINESASNYD